MFFFKLFWIFIIKPSRIHIISYNIKRNVYPILRGIKYNNQKSIEEDFPMLMFMTIRFVC